MRIITGTILMVSLMMPAAVIADVTHKVSGNVTITKYKEGDQFKIGYSTRDSDNKVYYHSQQQLDQIQDNGTYPFEISCEPDPNHPLTPLHTCEDYDGPSAEVKLIVNDSLTFTPASIQKVYFE
jgi:hypothetical protein